MYSTPVKTLKCTLALMATLAMATGCSTKNADDPLETYNRGMFAVNRAVDTVLIRPVAKGYNYITPDAVRWRIGNMSDNLAEPLNMANSFLQGDFNGGMTSFWRFMINTTIGLGGMHDVAATAGLAEREEDFGQTLAVWGVGSGPYIVLPILGPSNLRDTGGKVGDWFMDPFNYALRQDGTDWTLYGVRGGQALVARERLLDPIDDIYDSSVDPYASFKSVYEQHRESLIRNQRDSK